MKNRRKLYVQIVLLVFGLSSCLVGVLLVVFLEPIHNGIIRTVRTFQKGSDSYSAWSTNNIDMAVYLFNWTNSEQIKNPKVKPKFERVGPYIFKEYREKTNIEWNQNQTITYKQKKTYHFDNLRSARSLEDLITTVNAYLLTIGYNVRESGFITKKTASYLLSTFASTTNVTETAEKIILGAFNNSILGVGDHLSLSEIENKFHLFFRTNGSDSRDGYYSMYYGTDENFGSLSSWNDKNTTDLYSGYCNQIKGSAGEFYPMNQKKDKIVLYAPELCRYVELEFVEEVTVKGIKGTLRPENRCFCKGDCNPSGVFNVSVCRQGSPTFISHPNFYNADPYYTDAIEGVDPDKERDEFYIVLEPKSGIVIDFAARMQVNMLLQPIKDISLFEGVRKAYIPILYFDQKVAINDNLVTTIKLLQHFPDICTGVAISLMAISVLILSGLFAYFCYNSTCIKKKYQKKQVRKPVSMEEIPSDSLNPVKS